jgi:hypothetical protein
VTLIGEGLGYHDLAADGIHLAEPDRALPTPTGVLRVGWELAREGKFTPRNELLPHYTRRPEAVRLWEARHGDRQG